MTLAADVSVVDFPTRIRAMEELLRQNAPRGDQLRRLPPESVEAMEKAGIFGMVMPRAWDGPEIDPLAQLDVIEALSRIDGSAGWCAMIGSDGGYTSAFIEDEVGRSLFRDINGATVVVVAPSGVAVPSDGGFTVTGQWAFASTSTHAKVFCLSCLEMTDQGPRLGPRGTPQMRICMFESEQVTVLDTWDTTGLRGSGSNDVALTSVFVPENRTFVLGSPGLRAGPLYQYPLLFLANVGGVPTGIAAGALADFVSLAPTKNAFGGSTKLAESGSIQMLVTDAAVSIEMARAGNRAVVGDLWAKLLAGQTIEPDDTARMYGMIAGTFDICARTVDSVYQAAGRDGLFTRGTLDRRMRDMLAGRQHVMASAAMKEAVGRKLLGLPTRSPFF